MSKPKVNRKIDQMTGEEKKRFKKYGPKLKITVHNPKLVTVTARLGKRRRESITLSTDFLAALQKMVEL